MRLLRALLAFFTVGHFAFAQPLVLNVIPAAHRTGNAGQATVDLVVLNYGQTEQPFAVPSQLAAVLTIGAKSWPIQLAAVEDPLPSRLDSPSQNVAVTSASHTIAGGRFLAQSYTFVPPPGASGPALIEVTVPGAAVTRGVIDVQQEQVAGAAARQTDAKEKRSTQKPLTTLGRAEPAAIALKRTFANRLAAHEPIYFIYGPDAPAAKLQFSFKYKLLQFNDATANTMARTLQFAFTQRSLWDLGGVSSPFYDTSYMPELLFESLAAKPDDSEQWFTWLGFQAAYKHESNGRDGPISRSLNTAYFRPVVALGNLDGWHLLVMPEVFAYLDNLEDNPQIKDYRGYGQLRVVFGRNDGPSLMATTWAGKNLQHGSVQLDLSVPVKTRFLDFETYLLLQYFNGFGESLRSYREKTETVRAGFSLVR